MDRIKVLRIITRLNIGGPAIHSIILTKELNDAEFESALLCGVVSKGEREMLYMARRWSVKPVLVSSLKREINPFFDMQALFQIIKFISDFKPHIVHTHTSKAGALGRIASILAGVPIRVHTFHGNIFTGYFGRVATKVFMFVERILSRFTDVVIVISSQQKSELIEKYRVIPSDRCRLVRLGFELDTFLNTQKRGFLRKRYGFNNDDILVGIIGRLVPIKNHKMFIDAVYYIKCHKDTEGLKFLLIGEGELKK
ncbi:MAG TPA: hypothetical protein EYP78_01925, partial [Candidatus Omnitrophica bacterium]|nr:hypothetical protein [Candidatus Omnitrophota bacterium]